MQKLHFALVNISQINQKRMVRGENKIKIQNRRVYRRGEVVFIDGV